MGPQAVLAIIEDREQGCAAFAASAFTRWRLSHVDRLSARIEW